jgi:hypothetical protein
VSTPLLVYACACVHWLIWSITLASEAHALAERQRLLDAVPGHGLASGHKGLRVTKIGEPSQ